jgi:II/X family phage/plasmid replication protein
MIDMVAISVPFLRKFVTESVSGASFIDDRTLLERFGVDLSGQVSWDAQSNRFSFTQLHHKFESLPSSHATLAFKIINGTDFKAQPYIKIVGNPAKLLQGHNVYGPDNLELSVMAVIQAFCFGDHNLTGYLDWEHACVDYLDLTYTAHVANQQQAQQCLDMMRNIKVGQTRPWYDDTYMSTIYFNKGSELRVNKVYLKLLELDAQINKLTRKFALTKYEHFRRQLEEINRPEVREFATGALRFEARLYRQWLNNQGLPTAVGLITDPELQKTDPELIPRLWRSAFQDIFKSFDGATMNTYDTASVLDGLKLAFGKETPSGAMSFAKANRLFGIYRNIMTDGFERTKSGYPRNTWGRYMKDLNHAGLSLAQLMNLTGEHSNVVPFIKMINVDFSKQLPADYVEPLPLAQQYQQNPALLRLVS